MKKITKQNEMENPLYHDTWMLLRKYRDVVWSLELSVQQVRRQFQIEFCLNEGINRDDLISKLKKRGVGVSVLFIPVTEFSYYKSKYENASKATPVCISIMNNIISLPLFTSMKRREIKYVIKMLRDEING